MIRHSAGFDDPEDAWLSEYASPGSEANRALQESLPGVDVSSTSSAIRALVLLGHRALQGDRLQRAYDQAIEAGDFDDEAEAWYRAAAPGIVARWGAE
jgi:hypothetical protein